MVFSVHFPELYQTDTIHPNLPRKRLRRSQVLPVVVLIILRDDPPEHSLAVLSPPLESDVDWKGTGDLRLGNVFETCWILPPYITDSGISFSHRHPPPRPPAPKSRSTRVALSGLSPWDVPTVLMARRAFSVYNDLAVIPHVFNRGRWYGKDGTPANSWMERTVGPNLTFLRDLISSSVTWKQHSLSSSQNSGEKWGWIRTSSPEIQKRQLLSWWFQKTSHSITTFWASLILPGAIWNPKIISIFVSDFENKF